MATVFINGFELGTTAAVTSLSGTASIQATTKRTGTYALQVNPTTTATGFVQVRGYDSSTGEDVSANTATLYVQFYFRYGTKPAANSEEILVARSTGSTDKFSLRLRSDGLIEAFDSAAASLGTCTTVLAADTWYRIACQIGTGAAAAYDVRINGTSELSGTGNLTTSNHNLIRLGKATDRNGQTINVY